MFYAVIKAVKLFLLVMVGMVCTATGQSRAAAVVWSGNGHSYEVVNSDSRITWSVASTAAQDAGGYLATITSKDENNFVTSLLNDPDLWLFMGGVQNGPWLGGFQKPGSSEPLVGWQWVTSEPWDFTAWAPGQPDNAEGVENYLGFWGSRIPSSTWNDYADFGTLELRDGLNAYVIERSTTVVPEPRSLLLLLSGLALLSGCLRRGATDHKYGPSTREGWL